MVPLIRKELVDRRKWVEDSEFVDMLAIAQSSPGPIAINTAVISGFKIRGIWGALVATLGSSLPSFLAILLIAAFFLHFKESRAVEAVFKGMRPAIFGLLVAAAWQVGTSSVKGGVDIAFLSLAAALLLLLKMSPIMVVLIAAAGGLITGRLRRTGRLKTADRQQDESHKVDY